MAPAVWKKNGGDIDIEVFRNNRVIAGLDLSQRNDLTACVLAAKDTDDVVHVLPFVFCPTHGIEARAKADRAPYDTWVNTGDMIPIGGETMDYAQIVQYLDETLDGLEIKIDSIQFDRWRIDDFKAACERSGSFGFCDFVEVGQGYKDFSPRCESLLNAMIDGRIRHGNHPLLTMAAANAVAVNDPSGNTKLDKSKSTQRIDPLIAMVMAVYPLLDGQDDGVFDLSGMIG